MANVKIGFRDFTSDASWSGGSWESDFPASNAGDIQLAKIARSTDATNANTQLSADLGQERTIQLFGMVLPNASTSATVQIIRKDSGGSQVGDSGDIDIYPSGFNLAQEEVDNFIITRPYSTGDSVSAQTIEFKFKDSGNSDGFFDVAYIGIAEEWEPTVNFRYGFAQQYRSRSRGVQARGGAKTFDKLQAPRQVSAEIALLDHDETMRNFFEMQRRLDIADPFIWHPFPDDSTHYLRHSFIARFRELTPIERVLSSKDNFTLEIEEVI